jgi:RNA polymerase sigma factor (sigma-70 family)
MMNAGETELDEVLVQRTRRGDAVALAALATRCWNALHRIGWNMLSDPAAAGELAEAALLSALRSTEAFPRDVPFRTALYRQAISRSLIRLHSAPSSATRSLATFGGRHLGEWIREKLQHLDALDRAAFLLREIEQFSLEDAAVVLRISPENVRRRTHRASLILSGFLGHLFERSLLS